MEIAGVKISSCNFSVLRMIIHVIVVHAGTDNLSTTSPEQLSKEVLYTLQKIQENNKESRIVFSSIFKCTDKGLNPKIIALHKILNEELTLNGFDIFDNDNIHFPNLAKDGLHLDEDDTRKYASSLNKFMRYYKGRHCSSVHDSTKYRPIPKRNDLKIAFPNTVSLRKHRSELSMLLHEHSIEAIGLCETRLDNKVTDSNASIAGYRVFRNDRNRNGGGVAICIKEDFPELSIGN